MVFEFPATCEILVASYEVSEGSFARPETVLIGRPYDVQAELLPGHHPTPDARAIALARGGAVAPSRGIRGCKIGPFC